MLVKNKEKPSKQMIANTDKLKEKLSKEGIKVLSHYWTLGRYDDVVIIEAPDEKAMLKVGLALAGTVATETLVAIPRKEAIKLLG
jgi:uncharacterized protein with GYD domain